MRKSRRFRGLSGLASLASLLFSIGGISFSTSDAAGLRDLADKAYLNIGVATDRPSSYTKIVAPEYNIIVCENAMKFASTEPTEGNFTFSGGDAVLSFATTNNMKMRGHCLVWHAQTSAWIQSLNRTDMLAGLKEHINGVLTHYKGKILEWDVVNEALSGGTNSFYATTIGTGYIDTAFKYANQADPAAYLYYNDYGGEGTGGRGDQIYNMVKTMLQNGIPIHGVGMQCHFTNSIPSTISANIKRLGDLGIRVSLTEIDIANTSTDGTPWTALMQACLENFNCTTFLVWGVDDAVSWRGSSCGCTIFDGNQTAKPAVYNALTTALNNADPTIAAKRKTFSQTPTALIGGRWVPVTPEYKRVLRITFSNNILSFNLPRAQNVHVHIFDIQGKVAGDLNLGLQASGDHAVRLTCGQLPAGLYFAKIKTGEQSMTLPFTRLTNR